MSSAQSEKPRKAITVMAIARRTSPPPSIVLAQAIGLNVMVEEYPGWMDEPTSPTCETGAILDVGQRVEDCVLVS
jgi:hypothetical protein